MKTIADKERDHDNVFRGGGFIAITYSRLLFHENRKDLRINVHGADAFYLKLDDFAGVLVVAGSMTRDEERDLGRLRFARKGMFLHDLPARASSTSVMLSWVPTGPAIIDRLIEVLPGSIERALFWSFNETQFAWNDFFGEVAFADKERDHKDARGKDAPKHSGDAGLLFPEAFEDLREDPTATEFIGVLIRGGG